MTIDPIPSRAGGALARQHVCTCVCTLHRPALLARLLAALESQHSGGRFTHSIVVVDNDPAQSARALVERHADAGVPIRYVCEPRRNIALARNACIVHSCGDLIAFIDDDEIPHPDWLVTLVDCLARFRADGVLGPVKPAFASRPPDWIVAGRFYEKDGPPTGTTLSWQHTRTSNVLLRRSLFEDPRNLFDVRFDKGGEDVDLFRRLIAAGARFVWCEEAPVLESIPAERCSRRYVLRRALLRGQGTVKYAAFRRRDLLRSALAVPAYSLALPFALVLGQHRFMQLLSRAVEHAARFLAVAGIELVKRY